MGKVVDFCDDLTSLAPAGMAEYIRFNFEVFKATNEAMAIIDRRGEKIEKYAEEAVKEWEKTHNSENSTENVGDSLWNETIKNGPDAPYLRNR